MNWIIEFLKKELDDISGVKVEDVRVGLVYTGVLISTGHGGLAYNPIHEYSGCPSLSIAGEISGSPASEVMMMALSRNLIEASIGVATINALSQLAFEIHPERYTFSNIDVLDLIRRGDRVSMIGYFGPLIPKILKRTGEVYILEKRRVSDNRVRFISPSEMSGIIGSSDVILISGSTLVNKTIDEILRFGGGAREIVLLGPTASVIPHPLFERGVTAVMGVRIKDPRAMLRVISEAGGTRQILAKCAEKIAFLKRVYDRRMIGQA